LPPLPKIENKTPAASVPAAVTPELEPASAPAAATTIAPSKQP